MTSSPVISLRGVAVRYGQHDALTGVDLCASPGERVALVGPSGAGKSTLLRLLAGLARPTAGSVAVFGRDPTGGSDRRLRRLRADIGTVHQGLDLAGPLRVVHNVNAGRLGRWSLARSLWSLLSPAGRDEVDAVLAAVGLPGRSWDRTDQLSGGEQQRVAVARVLLQRPRLLLADEPVSSLDPALSDRVLSLLCRHDEEAAPWTGVISLHEPDLARRHCTRLVGLDGGRIVFDLPAGEVDDRRLDRLYDAGRS